MKDKYLRGLEGRVRVSEGADPCTSGGDGNWQWEKTALPGEKGHQTEAGENGNVVEETCGAGILPRAIRCLRGRWKSEF